jgi:hypothetical protein
MDAAWRDNTSEARRHQDWFVHIGRGDNIRRAAGLPVPLTKLMAHHVLLAPGECTIPQGGPLGPAPRDERRRAPRA